MRQRPADRHLAALDGFAPDTSRSQNRVAIAVVDRKRTFILGPG
jgi:hypothetical protein